MDWQTPRAGEADLSGFPDKKQNRFYATFDRHSIDPSNWAACSGRATSFAFEADEFPCAGRAAEIDANRIEPCRVSIARRADVNADK